MSNSKSVYGGISFPIWTNNFEVKRWNGLGWIPDGKVLGYLEAAKNPKDDRLLFLRLEDVKIYDILSKDNELYYIITNIQYYPRHQEITLKWLNKTATVLDTVITTIGAGELTQKSQELKSVRIAFDGISGSVGGGRFVEGGQSASAYVFNEVNFDRERHKLKVDGQIYNITQIVDESGNNNFVRLTLERSD